MKFVQTNKKDRSTSRWAGGTTTQLAIFPPDAEFLKFNFLFRISTATVEVEESTFTHMPGVTRHLMILDGNIEINHTDRYTKKLMPFESDTFSGEWPTTAKGKVTDFNLMTTGNVEGRLGVVKLTEAESKYIEFDGSVMYSGFYLTRGKAMIRQEEDCAEMVEGDFVLFTHEGRPENLVLSPVTDCEMVISKIVPAKQ